MPKIVDHTRRREFILEQSLIVFNEFGIKDTSLALIAERVGISRPVLYNYFNDKENIFYFAIKSFTDTIQKNFEAIAQQTERSVEERLNTILLTLLDEMLENTALIGTLTNYYFELYTEGATAKFTKAINRRTIKFKRLIYQLLAEGVKNGAFKAASKEKTPFIFALCESLFLQISLLGLQKKEHLKELILSAVNSLT